MIDFQRRLSLELESEGSPTPCEMSCCQRATRLISTMRWLPLQDSEGEKLNLAPEASLEDSKLHRFSSLQRETDEEIALSQAIAASLGEDVVPLQVDDEEIALEKAIQESLKDVGRLRRNNVRPEGAFLRCH